MSSLYRLKLGVYTKYSVGENNPLADQYYELEPQMLAMLLVFEDLAMDLSSDVVYTSLIRPDDFTSVHAHGRGADVRIYDEARGIPDHCVGAGIESELADIIVTRLKQSFGSWTGADGRLHETAIIHGEDLNRHIHLQCPARSWH